MLTTVTLLFRCGWSVHGLIIGSVKGRVHSPDTQRKGADPGITHSLVDLYDSENTERQYQQQEVGKDVQGRYRQRENARYDASARSVRRRRRPNKRYGTTLEDPDGDECNELRGVEGYEREDGYPDCSACPPAYPVEEDKDGKLHQRKNRGVEYQRQVAVEVFLGAVTVWWNVDGVDADISVVDGCGND